MALCNCNWIKILPSEILKTVSVLRAIMGFIYSCHQRLGSRGSGRNEASHHQAVAAIILQIVLSIEIPDMNSCRRRQAALPFLLLSFLSDHVVII